jgi:hypothetical protein
MRHALFSYSPFAAYLSILIAFPWQPRDAPSCHVEIVSATVITTFCGHAAGTQQVLDLFIMWRGSPGWFQRRENGSGGQDVVRDFAGGKDARVAQYSTYANVTIGFDADFDARTVRIDGDTLSLTHHNTIVVDNVDTPHMRRIATAFRVETMLPPGDTNFILARKSARVRAAFQCTAPVPSSPSSPLSAARLGHVTTVCERLRQ